MVRARVTGRKAALWLAVGCQQLTETQPSSSSASKSKSKKSKSVKAVARFYWYCVRIPPDWQFVPAESLCSLNPKEVHMQLRSSVSKPGCMCGLLPRAVRQLHDEEAEDVSRAPQRIFVNDTASDYGQSANPPESNSHKMYLLNLVIGWLRTLVTASRIGNLHKHLRISSHQPTAATYPLGTRDSQPVLPPRRNYYNGLLRPNTTTLARHAGTLAYGTGRGCLEDQ